MKPVSLPAILVSTLCFSGWTRAHDLGGNLEHPHYDWSVKPPEMERAPEWFVAQADTSGGRLRDPTPSPRLNRPFQAAVFQLFAPLVSVRWDARYLYVEDNGMPAHNMMVGITNWQQQVPLPQAYTGNNAWRIPLVPVPAKSLLSIRGNFLRGAIAIAANGIPIFNPQNNRGEISAEIGELDQWGGHCGRADDYHYHAAPLHLQEVVGKDKPIAYALDGYPIYGLTEPDGSPPAGLDSLHGHTTAALGYHYHASTKYPYVNGGFHGEVVEAGGQVDPQPKAQPVREAGKPLREATITGFEMEGKESYKLTYDLKGEKRAILYQVNADGTFPFEYQNGREGTTKEVYTRRDGGGERREAGRPPESAPAAPSASAFALRSPEVANGGVLPVDYTGDGSGSTLPLEWDGAPAGTKSFALIMHHLDREGITKTYWILYDIPANITALPKNTKGVGALGASFKGMVGYEPPRSQGPGPKTYVLTLYALSGKPEVKAPPEQVNYDVILAAMKGEILASADLSVVYTRGGNAKGAGPAAPPRHARDESVPGPDGQDKGK